MSSRFPARNTPAFQRRSSCRPRRPASHVFVTTWSSGGSPAMALGSLHGWSGSAQPSSMDVAARLPSAVPQEGSEPLRRSEGHAHRRIESAKRVIAVERAGTAAGLDAVAIADRRLVVAPGQGEMPGLADGNGVRRIEAPRADPPVQIDTGVVRLAVDLAARLAVAERADAGHAPIGIEVSELRGLHEIDVAPVIGAAHRELVAAAAERAAQRRSAPSPRRCPARCACG